MTNYDEKVDHFSARLSKQSALDIDLSNCVRLRKLYLLVVVIYIWCIHGVKYLFDYNTSLNFKEQLSLMPAWGFAPRLEEKAN